MFPNQAAAAPDIRALAAIAARIDVLAVRGLGLFTLNDSLLRPAIENAERLRITVLLSESDSPGTAQRAAEVGEPLDTFTAGIDLAVARLREIGERPGVTLEVYRYDSLPVWRIIGIDHTLFVATFAENWEGHESAVYKVVPTPTGTLHSGFRRTFDHLRSHAERVI